MTGSARRATAAAFALAAFALAGCGGGGGTASAPAPPPAATVDLSVAIQGSPNPVTVDNALTYTVAVTNGGPAAARNVRLTVTLPPGADFVSATPSQGACSGTGPVVCDLGGMDSGNAATVVIVVIPRSPGSLTGSGLVTNDVADSDGSDDFAQVLGTAVAVPGAPTVVGTVPSDGAVGVPLATDVRVTFSEPVDPATLDTTTFHLAYDNGAPATGNLRYGTTYRVTITRGVRDLDNVALDHETAFRFTTEAPPPTTATVRGILLLDNNTAVAYDPTANSASILWDAFVSLSGAQVRAVHVVLSGNYRWGTDWDNTVVADRTGVYYLYNTPPVGGSYVLSAELLPPSGPVARVIGAIKYRGPIDNAIAMRNVTPDPAAPRLDLVCVTCHYGSLDAYGPGQLHLHRSGVHESAADPAIVSPPLWNLDAAGWVVCESCHTFHRPTSYADFLHSGPPGGGTWCNNCH